MISSLFPLSVLKFVFARRARQNSRRSFPEMLHVLLAVNVSCQRYLEQG